MNWWDIDWEEYNRGREAVRILTRLRLECPDLWEQIKQRLR